MLPGTAYAIANVIVIPMTSWLSQQFGRQLFCRFNNYFHRRFFLCGNATNMGE
jgi:DHA2 family multidrug resistance protein